MQSARKKTGDLYAPASLICIRASIQLYLSSRDVHRQIKMIDHDDLKRANQTLREWWQCT